MAPWGLISCSKLSVCALWAKDCICISAHLCSSDFLLKCHHLSGIAKLDGGIIDMFFFLMLLVCCLGGLLGLECFISFSSSVFFPLLVVRDWVLLVPGVVEFCSVVVWGIE